MKTHHVESTWLGKELPQEFVLAPYETLLQLMILLYPYLWQRDEEANPDRRGSDVQPFQNLTRRNSGIDGWMEALQPAGYETEVTGCDKKKERKVCRYILLA